MGTEPRMKIENLAPVLPVADLAAAVEVWSALLGVEATFVDGQRWAQFDIAGRRLALAGTDRDGDAAGVIIKVDDLADARRRVAALGLDAGDVRRGAHESRFTAIGPGGWPVTFYAPQP
jgi:hypothetical protein